jgi:hypothetical protein
MRHESVKDLEFRRFSRSTVPQRCLKALRREPKFDLVAHVRKMPGPVVGRLDLVMTQGISDEPTPK